MDISTSIHISILSYITHSIPCLFKHTYAFIGIESHESTPLNKLAVADAAWARMPVDSLNMTLA